METMKTWRVSLHQQEQPQSPSPSLPSKLSRPSTNWLFTVVSLAIAHRPPFCSMAIMDLWFQALWHQALESCWSSGIQTLLLHAVAGVPHGTLEVYWNYFVVWFCGDSDQFPPCFHCHWFNSVVLLHIFTYFLPYLLQPEPWFCITLT
jgi:hypothetical protein